ncbi:hypothetical protein [Rhizobium sp. ARZ01]|uniref:hypothetical protein n=1 Tax=Rhizobium sp. ARZ01 TaxID=2769313 RepID=UPI001FEFE143|nr:hypothetical protein [Rhizobium sp. ARZ01]
MYVLKPGIKRNPEKRWALPDRIFFGYGACHILAGVFLERPPLAGFYAEHIVPDEGYPGAHIYVTDGTIAFDYHSYCGRDRLLEHHSKGWIRLHEGWSCEIRKVDYRLLDTDELNQRKMLGPDQFLHDPIPRARRFIDRINHAEVTARALERLRVHAPASLAERAGFLVPQHIDAVR